MTTAHIDTLRAKRDTLAAEQAARTSRGLPTPGWFVRHIELLEDQIACAEVPPLEERFGFTESASVSGWVIVVGCLLAVAGICWAVFA